MARRRKFDLEKIHESLKVSCPHCGARLAPNEQIRIDWEHLECPRCGQKFIPESKGIQSTQADNR